MTNLPGTGSIHQMFGVFYNGELEAVEFTMDHAQESARNISSKLTERGMVYHVPANRIIKPVFVLETDLASHFLFGIRETLQKMQDELKSLKLKEEEMINIAVREHSILPDNYWQPRYKAWLKVEATKRLIEVLEQQTTNAKFTMGA